MKTARLEVRLTEDLKEQVDKLRDESGVPTSTFISRLIKAALPPRSSKSKAKPRRRKIAG